MNRRRVAALLRRKAELQRHQAEMLHELAKVDDAMADAMTEETDVSAAPRRRGGSVRAPVIAPDTAASPEARAKVLRRLRVPGART